MSKSIVATFCGGRGSGKTLSMSTEGALRLVAGENVWANYPIAFKYIDKNGKMRILKSRNVDIEDLVSFKTEIRDGAVLLDELNLWAGNRNSQALVNRLLNSWIQIIRHRKLSVFITCQAFESLDKMIRWQTDVVCVCSDLSFRYSNLKEGEYISQRVTDWSGVFTGRPLFHWNDMEDLARNTATRILHGARFFDIYNTESEYDILKAMTRYEVHRETKIIGRMDDAGFRGLMGEEKLKEWTDTMRQTMTVNKLVWTTNEMKKVFTDCGMDSIDGKVSGRILKRLGFEEKKTKKGDFYVLNNRSKNVKE